MLSAAFASLVALENGYTTAALTDAAIGGVDHGGGSDLHPAVRRALIGLNVTAGDQYVADVLPSRMFRDEFERRGLPPEVLRPAVEDSGTVTCALVPWNTCGAYMSGVFGVSTASYLPY